MLCFQGKHIASYSSCRRGPVDYSSWSPLHDSSFSFAVACSCSRVEDFGKWTENRVPSSLSKWVVTNEKWAVMMVVTYNMNGVDMLTMQTNMEWATLVKVYAL